MAFNTKNITFALSITSWQCFFLCQTNKQMMKLEKDQEQEIVPVRIKTKLKFVKSDSGCYVGYASQNLQTGVIRGVRETDNVPKKVCVVDKSLAYEVVPNVLYDVTMIPMKEKYGYVVIEMSPVSFKAVIETTYVPLAIYKIDIKFGGKSLTFDPLNKTKDSKCTIEGCRDSILRRYDIEDVLLVAEDFTRTAKDLMRRYENDCKRHKRVL